MKKKVNIYFYHINSIDIIILMYLVYEQNHSIKYYKQL